MKRADEGFTSLLSYYSAKPANQVARNLVPFAAGYGIAPNDLVYLGALYKQNDLHVEAEEMYIRALRVIEKAWGPEHMSTLNTVNNLGNLYKDQGKMAETEEMYMRALRGYEKAVGKTHARTQIIALNLRVLQARE